MTTSPFEIQRAKPRHWLELVCAGHYVFIDGRVKRDSTAENRVQNGTSGKSETGRERKSREEPGVREHLSPQGGRDHS